MPSVSYVKLREILVRLHDKAPDLHAEVFMAVLFSGIWVTLNLDMILLHLSLKRLNIGVIYEYLF